MVDRPALFAARLIAPNPSDRLTHTFGDGCRRPEKKWGYMIKKMLFGAAAAAAVVALPATAAFADSCTNLSRDFHAPPPPCFTTCTSGPITEGNWVWLPSVDPHAPPIWGFAPPGAQDSQLLGTPGANGNYTNGHTSSLLGMSAICNGGVPARQTSSGIQTGCE